MRRKRPLDPQIEPDEGELEVSEQQRLQHLQQELQQQQQQDAVLLGAVTPNPDVNPPQYVLYRKGFEGTFFRNTHKDVR